MDVTTYRLLERLVVRYDTGDKVTAGTLAAADEDPAAVRERLARLERCDLLVRENGSYRPTVTGRELLALDVENPSVLVVDPDGEC